MILLVPDPGAAAELGGLFERARFGVERVTTGAAAVSRCAGRRGVLVIEGPLPDVHPGDVCRTLRARPDTWGIGIVVITGPGPSSAAERVEALEHGADDCLSRPLSARELVLRLEALARRTGAPASRAEQPLVAGDIALDVARHRAWVRWEPIALTLIEFRILHSLCRAAGGQRSRAELLAEVWGEDRPVRDRTIDAHIKRLRDKLGPARDQIETVIRGGYRLRRGRT